MSVVSSCPYLSKAETNFPTGSCFGEQTNAATALADQLAHLVDQSISPRYHELLSDAKNIFTMLDDKRGIGLVHLAMANANIAHNLLDDARKNLTITMRLFDEIGLWNSGAALSLADLYAGTGEYEKARELTARSITWCENAGDLSRAVWLYGSMSIYCSYANWIGDAHQYQSQAMSLAVSLKYEPGIGFAHFCAGYSAFSQGQFEYGLEQLVLCRSAFSDLGELEWGTIATFWISFCRLRQDDLSGARELLSNLVDSFPNERRLGITLEILKCCSELALKEGLTPTAVQLYAAENTLRRKVGWCIHCCDVPTHNRHIVALRSAAPDPQFTDAMTIGEAMSWQEAVKLVRRELFPGLSLNEGPLY